jgi:hypothetical protein
MDARIGDETPDRDATERRKTTAASSPVMTLA